MNKRIFKGKSSALNFKNYTIVDIETTGFQPSLHEIIELSAIKVRDNKQQCIFQSLVKPKERINEFITDLTGITNEMLKSAPPIEIILPEFFNFIGNDAIVGHNVNFDINFIYDYCIQILNKPLSNNFIDTMWLARKIFPNSPDYKLTTLARYLNLTHLPAHRGMKDCEATWELYQVIINCIEIDKSTGGIIVKSNAEFNKISSKNLTSRITPNKTTINKKHLFYGKYFVFTGKLQKMRRKEAMQVVFNLGGNCTDEVTMNTNYLVLGSFEHCKILGGNKSKKIKRAEALIIEGQNLQIISENDFYDLIETEKTNQDA